MSKHTLFSILLGLLAMALVLVVPVVVVSCSVTQPVAPEVPPPASDPEPTLQDRVVAVAVAPAPPAPAMPGPAPLNPASVLPEPDAGPDAAPELWIIERPSHSRRVTDQLEEVKVTGSFVRRGNFELPSPTRTLDPQDQFVQLDAAKSKAAKPADTSPASGAYRSTLAHDLRNDPGSGAMLAGFPVPHAPERTRFVPLPLKHTAVDAAISGYIGTVNVKQEYENPYDTKIEAVYVFPLPEKAAVSEFLMIIGDRTIRGILREKEEAEAIYKEARLRGFRASLLVQRRPNVFEQKVANIEPGKAIDIDITYFHTLAYKDGWYSFVFPTVVGPRYNPPGYPDPVKAVERGRGGGTGTSVEYLRPDERSGHDISINVRLDAGVEIEEVKASHGIDVTRDGESTAVVQLRNESTIPNRDFVLDFRVAGERLKSNLLTHRDSKTGESYFTLMVIPPKDSTLVPRQAMEMVFVLDCSGSMRGQPLAQAKDAVRVALDRLDPGDTFQIIRFADTASQFGTRPVPATERNLTEARRYLEMLGANGGTQMINGVKAALDFPHDPSRFRFVTFMTDGFIGNERDILAAVHGRIGASRIFSFGVGSSVNRFLMEPMAEAGRGVVAYLGLNDSARDVMDGFFARVSRPALTDVEVDWNGMAVTDVYPPQLPDLFVGRPLVVTGKFTGDPTTVRVLGFSGGERRTVMAAGHEQDEAGSSLAKVWARLRIADLADRATWAGDPYGELGDAIRNTALRYQLVSNYTSFVAVDSSHRTPGGHGVTVRQPVPVPDGVRYETTVD
ncbi:MAG: VWA domain-containing protein [Gammaproteobacteria bacterium]|nr:VWA domain-containing protein [Gammaproteobacteria bacterium]